MLRRIIEPANEILFLAVGIILAVGFAFVFSFFPGSRAKGGEALRGSQQSGELHRANCNNN